MRRPKLYVTDLDGTLLRDDGTLSLYARSSLERMLIQGLRFTIASARSVFSMQQVLQGLPITRPIISINGGYISDLATGRHHLINSIDSRLAAKLLEMIGGSGMAPWVSTFDGTRDRLYYHRVANDGMQWYPEDRLAAGDTRLRYLDCLTDALSDEVVCLIVMGKKEQVGRLRTSIAERYGNELMMQFYENRYSPGWHWLSIHDAGATKGRALQTLVARWELEDLELVVFGDAENDIEMFRVADRAIAVANAEAPLKPYATELIGRNSDDSVARFIAAEFDPAADLRN